MGKIHSKHVCRRTAPEGDCFLVNTKVTSVKDLMAAINSGSSLSEQAFVELAGSKKMRGEVPNHESPTVELTDFLEYCGKPDSNGLLDPRMFNIPLRVTLPPVSKETDILKLFTIDRGAKEEGSDSILTDTTDNNHGSQRAEFSKGNDCGLTVEADSGSELQEWLFTLYDFDDLGKITKEDIAGLLKSLYDTVGSVITLQRQGTRVLKLHLTVSPDENPRSAAQPSGAKANQAGLHDHQNNEGTKISDTVQSTLSPVSNGHPGVVSSKKTARSKYQPMSSLHHGSPRMPYRKTPENQPHAVCGKEKRVETSVAEKRESRPAHVFPLTRRLSFCGTFEEAVPAVTTAGAVPSANVHRRQQRYHCSSASRRMSQFDERHLAHLIQQNMDLNDQHPHYPRRTRRRHSIFVNKTPAQDHQLNRTCTGNVAVDCEESAQRRNHYLDLAGIENYETSNAHEAPQPDFGVFGAETFMKFQKPVKTRSKMASSAVKNINRCNPGKTDAHGADTISEENGILASNVFVIAKQDASHLASPKLSAKSPTTVNVSESHPMSNEKETVSSSHYHRRHRHREKNQSRAMKQVAEWIEKEHVCHKSDKRVVVVQRHEHHHVHEHFHHHFHHCSNT